MSSVTSVAGIGDEQDARGVSDDVTSDTAQVVVVQARRATWWVMIDVCIIIISIIVIIFINIIPIIPRSSLQ